MLFDKELTSLLLVPEGMEGAAVLPDSLATVPAYVLSRCIKLSAMQGSTAQSALTFQDGIIYTKDKATLLAAPAGLGTTATIAPECTTIAEGAFAGNIWLKTIVANGMVESIATSDGSSEDSAPKGAFEQAAIKGATVVINAADADYEVVKAVWAAAGFQSFAEPPAPGASIEPIKGSGFAFTLLDDYTLSVRWQGDDPAPANLQIPLYGMIDDVRYKVSAIADGAFKGQPGIQRVEIPDSVRRIGDAAFEGAASLHTVDIPGSVSEIGAAAFKDCKSLIAAELNEGLATIGDAAFEAAPQISWILPKSIKAVGDYAFANSPNLETVVALGTIATIGTNALAGVTNCKVYAPYNEGGEYLWKVGPAASANHLYPYGMKLSDDPVEVAVGQSASLFDNGGYLHAPEGFEVEYSYKAKPVSISDDGMASAKEPGVSNIRVSAELRVKKQAVKDVSSKDVQLARASFDQNSVMAETFETWTPVSLQESGSVMVLASERGVDDRYKYQVTYPAPTSDPSEWYSTSIINGASATMYLTVTVDGVSKQYELSDEQTTYITISAPSSTPTPGPTPTPMTASTSDFIGYNAVSSNTFVSATPEYTKYEFDGNGGTVSQSLYTVIKGKKASLKMSGLPTVRRDGYSGSLGWSSNKDSISQIETIDLGLTVTGPKAWYAVWTSSSLIDYDITYTLDGGNVVNGGSLPRKYTIETETFTLPALSKSGYTFKGWTGTGLSATAPGEGHASVTIPKGSMGDRSYSAVFVQDSYSIKTTGGTGVKADSTSADPSSYSYNSSGTTAVKLSAEPQDGYDVTTLTWTSSDTSIATINSDKKSATIRANARGDVTFTASYKAAKYAITAEAKSGSPSVKPGTTPTVSLDKYTFSSTSNTTVTLSATPNDGYNSKKPTWQCFDANGNEIKDASKVAISTNSTTGATTATIKKGTFGNLKFVVTYAAATYDISYDATGTGISEASNEDSATSYTYDPEKSKEIVLYAKAKIGYDISTVKWSITTDDEPNNKVTAKPDTLVTNEEDGTATVTVTIPAKLTGDLKIKPNCQPKQYDLVFVEGTGAASASVNPSDKTKYTFSAVADQTIVLEATADTGYDLKTAEWESDNEKVTVSEPAEVNGKSRVTATIPKETYGNLTFAVSFGPAEYTVSFDANKGSGGQSASVQATFTQAMPAISTNPPTRTGYTFKGWYDNPLWDAPGAKRYYTEAGASARNWDKAEPTTLYAGWQANKYKVEFFPMTQHDDPDAQPISCEGVEFTYGEPSTIAAHIESTKYTFVGWYKYGEPEKVYPAGQEMIFNLSEGDAAGTAHVSMFPVWAPLNSKYTVHFDGNGTDALPVTGEMADIEDVQMGKPFKLPENAFVRSGYEFLGWSTDPDAKAITGPAGLLDGCYEDEQENVDLVPTEDAEGVLSVTLYAVWGPQIRWAAPITERINLRVDPETGKLVGASASEADAAGEHAFRSWTSEKLYVASIACEPIGGDEGTVSVFPDEATWNHVYIKLREAAEGGYEESMRLGQTIPGYGLLKPYTPGSCFVLPAQSMVPKIDEDGEPVVDSDGKPVMEALPGTLDVKVGLETFDDVRMNIIGIDQIRGVAKLTYQVAVAYDD